jgi:site-specific DNA-methyltransferase (adenine-specific)
MAKQRAERNRTISLTETETYYYLSKCIRSVSSDTLADITDAIILGDALEVVELLPTDYVDLLIVDPPYNLNKTFSSTSFKHMSDAEYAAFTENWILKAKPILKNTASIYVCCDWRTSLIIGTILQQHFNVQNRITWQREKGRGAAHNWKNSMEDIWFATMSPKTFTFNVSSIKVRRKVIAPYKSAGKPKDWQKTQYGNFRDTFPSNFWDDISIPYWSMSENTDHPTQKPEKLIAKLILASSNPGDTVLDMFAGSGTTAVVAKKLNRHYIGIECEEEYCALAQRRLEIADKDVVIQGYSDGVFWERNTLTVQQKFKTHAIHINLDKTTE